MEIVAQGPVFGIMGCPGTRKVAHHTQSFLVYRVLDGFYVSSYYQKQRKYNSVGGQEVYKGAHLLEGDNKKR